jgi:DNA-binding IclR family transcriptional regulator
VSEETALGQRATVPERLASSGGLGHRTVAMAKRIKQKAGIKSVEVASQILRALVMADRPVALRDLARHAQMHPSKVHRYLVSLTRAELVSQDDFSGHYGIGPLSIALGLCGLRNMDVVREATSFLSALRDEIDETVLLSIWSPKGPVVFALEESSRPVFMNVRVGSILPLLTSATGRVFAAFLPEAAVHDLLAIEGGRSEAAATRRVLDDARRNGCAAVQGALVPGVSAIAFPIFDHKSRIAGVIGALGGVKELDVSPRGKVAGALARTAREISRRLGSNVVAGGDA